MQDNAPEHAAEYTKAELQNRSIRMVPWPPYSPDLNKDWIQVHYGNQDKLSYNILRKAVGEAWDAVTSDQLDELIDKMPDRCQAVIDSDGKHTRF